MSQGETSNKIVFRYKNLGSPVLMAALTHLRRMNFSNGRLAYWIMRIGKRYDTIHKQAVIDFQEIMKKFSVKIEDLQTGDDTTLPAAFIQARDEFEKQTVDGEFNKLRLSELYEARLSAQQLEALEDIIEFDVDYDAPTLENVTPLKKI